MLETAFYLFAFISVVLYWRTRTTEEKSKILKPYTGLLKQLGFLLLVSVGLSVLFFAIELSRT